MACIRKRRGKWVLDYRDAEKVRRWQTFNTKREAEEALPAALRESRQDRPPVSPNTPLKEWADLWLKQRTPDLAPRTLKSYRELLDLYVLPTLVPFRSVNSAAHMSVIFSPLTGSGKSRSLMGRRLSVRVASTLCD